MVCNDGVYGNGECLTNDNSISSNNPFSGSNSINDKAADSTSTPSFVGFYGAIVFFCVVIVALGAGGLFFVYRVYNLEQEKYLMKYFAH